MGLMWKIISLILSKSFIWPKYDGSDGQNPSKVLVREFCALC